MLEQEEGIKIIEKELVQSLLPGLESVLGIHLRENLYKLLNKVDAKDINFWKNIPWQNKGVNGGASRSDQLKFLLQGYYSDELLSSIDLTLVFEVNKTIENFNTFIKYLSSWTHLAVDRPHPIVLEDVIKELRHCQEVLNTVNEIQKKFKGKLEEKIFSLVGELLDVELNDIAEDNNGIPCFLTASPCYDISFQEGLYLKEKKYVWLVEGDFTVGFPLDEGDVQEEGGKVTGQCIYDGKEFIFDVLDIDIDFLHVEEEENDDF